jgi:sugar phosphate isomerase/epimerase
MTTRRQFLKNTTALSAFTALGASGFAEELLKMRLKIGACDWSIGKRADVTGLALAKQIGLSGIQVDLGNKENNLHLREKAVQDMYLKQSKETGIKITSLAIAELNNVPYKSEPETEQWVEDSINVAKVFGVKVVLLAFFAKNDLRNDDKGKAEVVRRLKKVAPKAEKAGITLGIESYLTAEEHLDIMDKVGSDAVKVFYDFRNATDAGNDIYKEVKLLGKKNICELHMKENGLLLSKGSIDWAKVRRSLDAIHFRGDGWMQIEWSQPKGMEIVDCYKQNLAFLKETFA